MTPHKLLSPISNIVKEGNIAPINATFYSVPDDVDSLDSKAQLCTAQGSFVALSSEFRIPVAPPRRRNRHLDPKRPQSAQMLTQPVQSNISQNRSQFHFYLHEHFFRAIHSLFLLAFLK